MKAMGLAMTLLAVIVAAAATADDGRIEIGPTTQFPIVISQPGSYVLTTDLVVTESNVSGILIQASDVIVDLAGHVIQGPGPPAGGPASSRGIGIPANDPVHNLRIANGTIRGFHIGVYLESTTQHGGNRVENVAVSECNWGILAGDTIVSHSSANANVYQGIRCYGCVVEDCIAEDNLQDGILIGHGAIARGSIARDNGGYGIAAQWASLVSECAAYGNGGVGIDCSANANNNIVNNISYDNDGGNIGSCVGNGCHQNYAP